MDTYLTLLFGLESELGVLVFDYDVFESEYLLVAVLSYSK